MGAISLNGGTVNTGIDKATVAETGVIMQMPMRLGYKGDMWLLPLEPLIGVRGQTILTRRNIAKRKGIGSVKEIWATDDWEVTIQGTLENLDADELPTREITRMKSLYLGGGDSSKPRRSVIIDCALTDALGIGQLLIVDIEFPPTKTINRQDFLIRALSDEDFDLF